MSAAGAATFNSTVAATGFIIGSANIGEAELEILDGLAATTAELAVIDGNTSATSTTVAAADRVVLNDNGTMVQAAVTDLDTFFSASSKTLTNKTLTSPVISTITAAGDLTLDAVGDIILDADGTQVRFKDAGTEFLQIQNSSGSAILYSGADIILDADGADIVFKDGGTQFGKITNASTHITIFDGTTLNTTMAGANITFAGTVGSGAITSSGLVTGTGFTAGSAVLAEAELELLDGLTAGTAIASKVVTTDANIDTTGQRNLTISGELDAATLDISGDVDIDGDVLMGDDVSLNSDASQLNFGADGEISLIHVHNIGLILKTNNTGDDSIPHLIIQTGETDIAANDILGSIRFQAPDEGTGTDAIEVAAEILAISEGNFAADNNATSLHFRTAASEYATDKMILSSAGALTVNGGILVPDSNNIAVGTGSDFVMTHDGSNASLFTQTGNITIDNTANNADIIFKGTDGNADITALTLDMSAAGQATFAASVIAKTTTADSQSGNVTLNFEDNQNFVLTLTGNITLVNPTTETVGQSGFITLIQDGTGSRTLAVGNQYFGPGGDVPEISTGANSIDVIPYIVIAAGKILLGEAQKAFADAS